MCRLVGISCGGNRLSCFLLMNDASTICTSGSTKMSDIGISSRCHGLKGSQRPFHRHQNASRPPRRPYQMTASGEQHVTANSR